MRSSILLTNIGLAGVLIINVIVNIICNKNDIELNSTIQALTSSLLAILIYDRWIKNEKD